MAAKREIIGGSPSLKMTSRRPKEHEVRSTPAPPRRVRSWMVREDEDEHPAGGEDSCCRGGVVGDRSAHFDPRRHRLRMRGSCGRRWRPVRRRAGHQIERRLVRQERRSRRSPS